MNFSHSQRSSSSSSSYLSPYDSSALHLPSSSHGGGESVKSPSSPTTTRTLLTADASTSSYLSSDPPPQDMEIGNTTVQNDDFGVGEALSLYQTLAAIIDASSSKNATRSNDASNDDAVRDHEDDKYSDGEGECDGHTNNDDDGLAATNASLDDNAIEGMSEDEIGDGISAIPNNWRSNCNCMGGVNRDQCGKNGSTEANNERQAISIHVEIEPTESGGIVTGGSRMQHNEATNSEENDDNSTTSWTSSSSSTATVDSIPPASANFLHRHRKKIWTLAISLMSLWVHSQYTKPNQKRLRNGRYFKHNCKKLAVYQWLIQLLSPSRISIYILATIQKVLIGARFLLKSLPSFSESAAINSTLPKSVLAQPWNSAATTPLSHFLASAKTGDVSKVMLRGSVLSYLHCASSPSSAKSSSQPERKQRWSKTNLPSHDATFLNEIISTLLKHGCDDITTLPESFWTRFWPLSFPFAYLGALYWMMRRLQRQQLDDDDKYPGRDSLSKNPQERHTTTFDDVAGIDSSLRELAEVISYIRNPSVFQKMGALPPKGILLYGPPGSGKTLLARAIAGEAGRSSCKLGGSAIDCFTVCSGSEFVETYVGRGAARVRCLFRNVREEASRNFARRQKRRQSAKSLSSVINNGSAKGTVVNMWERMQSVVSPSKIGNRDDGNKKPMAIIFIDEIDTLAKRRDSCAMGLSSSLDGGGGCNEREQTLNQLLTEMDGFANGRGSSYAGVDLIVIAATNRPEVLDPAILRPGRFDRHVRVALPDARGRVAILRLHAGSIRLDRSSVDMAKLSTQHFSGADLRNVVNEAALLAVRSGKEAVDQNCLMEAVERVRAMMGGGGGHSQYVNGYPRCH